MYIKTDPEKEAIKKQQIILNKLLKKPENKLCADCKSRPPSWASINLGVFICIQCSGCHRELGVHISKIKSINLDSWSPDILENFKKINNVIANEYWEYNLINFDFELLKNDREKLMKFIRNKYEYKQWINQNEIDPMSKIIQTNNFNNNWKNNNNNFNFNNQPMQNCNNMINNQGVNNYNYYNSGNLNFDFQRYMNTNNDISTYNQNNNQNQKNINFNSNINDNNNKNSQNSFPNFNWDYFNKSN